MPRVFRYLFCIWLFFCLLPVFPQGIPESLSRHNPASFPTDPFLQYLHKSLFTGNATDVLPAGTQPKSGTDSLGIWMRTYHCGGECLPVDLGEHYDGGLLLMGWYHAGISIIGNWVTKTDANGNQLWNKKLGSFISHVGFLEMASNQFGEIFLAGCTGPVNGLPEPLVTKLDACGEKYWCKIVHKAFYIGYALNVISQPDGGCVILLQYYALPPFTLPDQLVLMRLDYRGNELWENVIKGNDPHVSSAAFNDLLQTPDNGFLLTGYCYYPEPTNPSSMIVMDYLIKADTAGSFRWEEVAENTYNPAGRFGGFAWHSISNTSGNCYYTSANRYYLSSPLYDLPALVRTDSSGQILSISELATGYHYGKLVKSAWVNDSMLIGSAYWFNQNNMSDECLNAVLFDTMGNIRKVNGLLPGGFLSTMTSTRDNKFFFLTVKDLNANPNVISNCTYLYKLNGNLDFDTLFLAQHPYDTLCPNVIVSDTILCDNCDLVAGMEELPDPEARQELAIFPNPAGETARIEFPASVSVREKRKYFSSTLMSYTYLKETLLSISDASGKNLQEYRLPDGRQWMELNVSTWNPGIYLLKLEWRGNTVASGKLLVK